MRKLIRRIRSLLVLVIMLVVAGGVGVFFFADQAVKTAVEKAGTRTLNVGVTVGRAKASVLSGAVGLHEITVANPPGYQGPALLRLQQVNLTTDAKSLFNKEVLIKDMKLDNMEVFVEQKGLQNNLYQVIKPLREPQRPTGKGLVIDNLEIRNVTVHVNPLAVLGQAQSMSFKLASIRMTELGRNEKMDIAVLISKIVLAVAEGIAQQGSGILPKGMIGDLGSILDKALDIGQIILGPGGRTPDGQQKDSLGKTVTDGTEGFFGGKKK